MRRDRLDRQFAVLKRFVAVYCRNQHVPEGTTPCEECSDLLEYAHRRLEKCPYDPKPLCKNCTTHCYRTDYREKVRAVMRFSGTYYVKRGRFDWLIRGFV